MLPLMKKMLKKNKITIALIVLTAIFASCQSDPKPANGRVLSQDSINDRMMTANKILTLSETDNINNYIARYQWKMKESGTGLRYMIYKEGKGKKAELGDIVKINYKTSLLNGVNIYSSDENGAKEFEVGKAQVESGLEEGILLLKVGDKAKFIIPSHLGFGLLGDENKIPSKAALVYDIELISIEKQNQKK